MIEPWLLDLARQKFADGDVEGFLFCARGSQCVPHLFLDNLHAIRAMGQYEKALYYVITHPNFGPALTQSWIRGLLGWADREKLRACGDPLPGPGPFTIYRGVSSATCERGTSWTGTLERAWWFANRLGIIAMRRTAP